MYVAFGRLGAPTSSGSDNVCRGHRSKQKDLDDTRAVHKLITKSIRQKLDVDMVAEEWRAGLMLDNCTAHNVRPKLTAASLKYLSANTTTKSQPTEQECHSNREDTPQKAHL